MDKKILRLREIREKRGFNQGYIADALNMKQQQYSRYELGVRELPMKHYIALAEFYGVSLDYLAGRSDEE